jgi:hypothetical protein
LDDRGDDGHDHHDDHDNNHNHNDDGATATATATTAHDRGSGTATRSGVSERYVRQRERPDRLQPVPESERATTRRHRDLQ